MQKPFARVLWCTVASGAVALALAPMSANAQADSPSDEIADNEIVVTGTLIRGSAPVGSNAINLSEERLEETGAKSSNELLASIPQVTNYFNRVPVADLAIAVNQIQVARPNLRNISPNNAASSAPLILVHGHRIASAGVNQASIDPDLIPTGAIERVEVVTEGGSSIYGADAVAGVINFITRKRFDGVKVGGSYGTARNYWQWDANATVGKDWGSGSLYLSYSYTKNDALFGRDRNYIRNVDYASASRLGRDRTCNQPNLAINTVFVPANVTLSAKNYALPGLVADTFNACDNTDDKSVVPFAQRHGVVAGLSQDLSDHTSIDVRAYYGERKTRSTSAMTGTVNVGPSNPYATGNLPAGVTLGGGVVATRAAVSFSLAPLLGTDSQYSSTGIKEWGVNAELKQDIGENWQVRLLGNWSESDSGYVLTQLSPARLAVAGLATTTATAFNPFVVTNNNTALVADLVDSAIAGQARDNLINVRAIAEGKLVDLPAGEVRMAAGYEHMNDSFQQRFSNDVRIGGLSALPFSRYKRHVDSLFGELKIPVLSDGKGGSMLTVSAAGRYDKYSDFGSTFNPKVGATFKPADWVSIRGNWGTSFTAPTPLDQLGSLRNTVSSFPFVAFTRPGDTPQSGSRTVAIQGSQPDLKPQKADTWSVGMDLTPVSGLRASVSYYDVKFRNILRTPSPDATIFTSFPNNITANVSGLTAEQLRAFGALAPGGSAVVEPLIASGAVVYEAVDFRTGNFGILKVTGVDFDVNYQIETGFGGIDLGVNGNHPLSRKAQVSPTAPVANELARENSKWLLQAMAGANVGQFRAQATVNHTGGYAILPTTSTPVQSRVNAFTTVNLFFKYDVSSESRLFRDLSFTVNVNNVLDKNPPHLYRNNQGESGYANGFTLGRMVIVGASKKF